MGKGKIKVKGNGKGVQRLLERRKKGMDEGRKGGRKVGIIKRIEGREVDKQINR